MKMHRVMFFSILVAAATLTACVPGGVRHAWIMRGQVLAMDDGVATVCVGTRDGAKVGQVLDVERVTVRPSASPKSAGATYTRSNAGQVKITELFDEHYARAQVLTGHPAVNDVVELEMK